MAITIVTRAGKGSPLNATEFDANFTNLAAGIENTSTGHDHDGTDSKTIAIGGVTGAVAEDDFIVADGSPLAWVRKTLAQVKTILGLVLTQTSEAVGFTLAGGTTSKTLTVTAATSLDEAVAMSSKAPKADAILTGVTKLVEANFSDRACCYTASATGIAQSATNIVRVNKTGSGCSMVFVFGKDQAGANCFFDMVIADDMNNAVVVLHSSTTAGSPQARTYSFAVTYVKLLMAAGTYDVSVFAIELATPAT